MTTQRARTALVKQARRRLAAGLLLAVVVAGSWVIATQTRARPTAPRSAAVASTALLDAFDHHQIVALGLAHGLRQQEDFVIGLLSQPRFAATVDSIVVEFGNARFQARSDRYIAGGDVSPKALRAVWRDQIGAAPDGVIDEAAQRFFAAVRQLNQTLTPRQRIRVALGDPAFDFRTLRQRDDIYAATGRRDRVFAAAAEREARGGRHVLLLSGFMHLVRLPAQAHMDHNALEILERGAKGRVWVILPYSGDGARGQADFERRYISRWPPNTVHALTGPLGAQPADLLLPDQRPPQPSANQPASPYPGLKLRAVGDALISFGPCSRLRTTRFSPEQYREPAYRAELNRRSRILTGRPFIPPPAELSDAAYCSTVAAQ